MPPLLDLVGPHDSERRKHLLGAVLAFVAGAVDVCGFLQLHEYTTHVTGTSATLAIALAGLHAVLVPAAILAGFTTGAIVSSVLVQWGLRRDAESEFALPVLLEALLVIAVFLYASPAHRVPTLALLAFTMGLQNATITRLSDKEIRTTHVTAMITDIGIQLGRALYINRSPGTEPVRCDRHHLAVLLLLVASFIVGGVLSAALTPHFGWRVLLPLAALLVGLGLPPVVTDLRRRT